MLEICEHCGKLIKRRGMQTEPWERDAQTGTVTMYREVPAEVWVHTLTQSSICRGVVSPNPPWMLAAKPRVRNTGAGSCA